jgi:flagellar biosynthetic protein FliR
MLAEFLQADLFAFLMVFARVGAVVMLLPGIGETFIPPRMRLMIGLGIALVVAPAVSSSIPPLPESPIALFLALAGETLIGLFIGTVIRVLFFSLQTGGMIVAYQVGLANALVNDPTAAAQGALFSAFLGILGVLLVFESGLHHLMLQAVADSYGLFAPGHLPPLDDFSNAVARAVADSFDLAMRIAAPFVVVALVFYLGLGLLGRLFDPGFHRAAAAVVLGLIVMAVTLAAGMTWFLGRFGDQIAATFGTG